MDADIFSLFGRKVIENGVDDVDEFGEEVFASPSVSSVIL